MELRDVGTGRERDAKFGLVAGILVVLRNALADLCRGYANNGIGGGVIVGTASENLDAQSPFLERILLAGKSLFDDVAQK